MLWNIGCCGTSGGYCNIINTISSVNSGAWTILSLPAQISQQRFPPERWTLTSGRARVEVINATPHPVTVAGFGPDAITIDPGAQSIIDGLLPGTFKLHASTPGRDAHYARTLALGPDQTYSWSIRPLQSTVHITNATRYELQIFVNGNARGLLLPGESNVMDTMPTGDVTLRAITPDGSRVYQRMLDHKVK